MQPFSSTLKRGVHSWNLIEYAPVLGSTSLYPVLRNPRVYRNGASTSWWNIVQVRILHRKLLRTDFLIPFTFKCSFLFLAFHSFKFSVIYKVDNIDICVQLQMEINWKHLRTESISMQIGIDIYLTF